MSSDLRSAAVPPLSPEDHVRGDPEAPLVILYADFTCPHCAVAHRRLDAAPVRLAFRHFALAARHPRAVALACAAEAAGAQGGFWEMYDALFADPGHVDDPHLWARVQRLGLDLERFEADRRDPEVARYVRDQVRGGLRAGVTTTPTLVHEGRLLPGPPTAETLERIAAA